VTGGGGGTSGGGGSSGGGGGGTSSGGGSTFASCSLAHRPPTTWVHGHIPLVLKTSIAAGLTVRVETTSGKKLGAAVVPSKGRAQLDLDTHLLPSNKTSALKGVVYVNGVKACAVGTTLKVDNVPPKVLSFAVRGLSPHTNLVIRASENVRISIQRAGHAITPTRAGGRRAIAIRLPSTGGTATVVLVDRAGNVVARKINWH
jgi:hypothetical protein